MNIEAKEIEQLIRVLDRSQRALFNTVIDHLVVNLMLLEIIEKQVYGDDPNLGTRMKNAIEVVGAWRKGEA